MADVREQRLSRLRQSRGLSQSELARRASVSRQALGAIESGEYSPGVAVALALARELGTTVEDLFGGEPVRQVSAAGKASVGARVALARVGGRVIATTQPAVAFGLAPPAGTVASARGARASVSTFRTAAEIDSTFMIAGCDPAATLLGEWIARRHAPASLVALPASSRGALQALARGRTHAAGVHLRDAKTGDYNRAAAHRFVRRMPVVLINFARWEIGLAVAPRNPLGVRGLADLARPRIRLVNREPGSGARSVLDEGLRNLGIDAGRIKGYAHEVKGHLDVASEVASGRADIGVTIRVAADVYGLGFLPIREERYDLAIAEREMDSLPVRAVIETLSSSAFARELRDLCGYDTRDMGQVIAQSA